MSGTTPVTPAQLVNPDPGIVQAASPKVLVQNALDDPQLLAVLTEALGPYVRQYGHSALVGSTGPVLILVAEKLGLTLSQDVSNLLSILLFVGVSYAWQAYSIWRGKANAPVQPAPPVVS